MKGLRLGMRLGTTKWRSGARSATTAGASAPPEARSTSGATYHDDQSWFAPMKFFVCRERPILFTFPKYLIFDPKVPSIPFQTSKVPVFVRICQKRCARARRRVSPGARTRGTSVLCCRPPAQTRRAVGPPFSNAGLASEVCITTWRPLSFGVFL